MKTLMVDFANMTDKLLNVIDWREFACGWGAAVANITITYPINKIIFRQVLLKK